MLGSHFSHSSRACSPWIHLSPQSCHKCHWVLWKNTSVKDQMSLSKMVNTPRFSSWAKHAINYSWLVVDLRLPLWKIWVRQLRLWFPIYYGTQKMFETTNKYNLILKWYPNIWKVIKFMFQTTKQIRFLGILFSKKPKFYGEMALIEHGCIIMFTIYGNFHLA